MGILATAKGWLKEIVEVGLLLAAVGVIIEILFGATDTPFIGGITDNLTGLITTLGGQGLVGLIALGVILHLISKARSAG